MPRLFSYGSLQDATVQLATFGRLLPGTSDELDGFALTTLRRGDMLLANVVRSADGGERVAGTAFEITEAELRAADDYERSAAYIRIEVTLASGATAWMYVEAPST
jgi:gamma-glutamylcyclotransferase (GGCT)/AIG2-like uncharacterized protein YtfP